MNIKNESSPLVTVITVNYNQSGVTLEFLRSLQYVSYHPLEVFVVDNGSPNDQPDRIKQEFPDIHLIKTGVNLGFAGGNNVAVRQAKGKYLLFINNDTEVDPCFLEPMVELLEQNPNIGMVSPKIHYYHTPNTFQFAGFTPFSKITIRNEAVGFGQLDKGQYDYSCETASIFGAAMLVPMHVIQEVGMMAEEYFLYYEEHDWAARIKRAGYQIYYQGQSLVLHKESISTVRDSAFQIYYMYRGRVLFARRNTKGLYKIASMMYHYLIMFPKAALSFTFRGRPDLARALTKAMWWNLRNPAHSSLEVTH